MNGMLSQNVEINNDVDSMGKVESSSRKLKFHDITYEKVSGAFKKRLAERDIKNEIKEEVRDFTEEGGQDHLDRISILMSQYKFVNSGVKESPELVARRAIRLNDQMIYNSKLNSKLINAMLEKEKVDNVSTINESEEEQLVNAINQISENEGETAVPEKTEEVAPVMPREEDFAPLFNNSEETPEENVSEVDNIDTSLDDLEKNINDFTDNMNEREEVEEEVSERGVLPMTDEEIEASRQLLKESEPRTDHKKFTFEDIFGTEEKEEENVVVPEENVMSSEEAFMEVDKLLQQADDLRSRGNKAMEEREKAEQRRRAAEDRRRQAADDEAMKKAALAKAIAEYKEYVAKLEETETETLKATEDANAAADREDEDTRALEERSAYTQKVIDSLMSSMESRPKTR